MKPKYQYTRLESLASSAIGGASLQASKVRAVQICGRKFALDVAESRHRGGNRIDHPELHNPGAVMGRRKNCNTRRSQA